MGASRGVGEKVNDLITSVDDISD